jgi:hypothetical protein
MDLLSAAYQRTALFLFEHLITLLEDRLFYEEGRLPFVPIPEHLGMFRIYAEAAKREGEWAVGLSLRVKAVLNGLMNQVLLSDVDSLEEEINYRETKNVHPTLYKMLNMKWKATSAKRAVSSIYDESFIPDYFYNHPHEKTDLCVSKIAWLTYATAEFNRLISDIGDELDAAALEQPMSLFKVLQHFMNSDPEAKQGKYFSINSVGAGVRLYAKQSGYESLLPFVYGLTELFPETAFKNITTRYGLASLNSEHPKANSHYEYRGNIHSYFNYKLIQGARNMLRRNEKKNEKRIALVEDAMERVQEWLLGEWAVGRTYTMWTVEGEGLRHRRQLSLLNAALLRK